MQPLFMQATASTVSKSASIDIPVIPHHLKQHTLVYPGYSNYKLLQKQKD